MALAVHPVHGGTRWLFLETWRHTTKPGTSKAIELPSLMPIKIVAANLETDSALTVPDRAPFAE